jgi:hypothetical protein
MAQRSRRTVHRIVRLTEKQWDSGNSLLRERGRLVDLKLADRVAKQVANAPHGPGRVRLTETQWDQYVEVLKGVGRKSATGLAERMEAQIETARSGR